MKIAIMLAYPTAVLDMMTGTDILPGLASSVTTNAYAPIILYFPILCLFPTFGHVPQLVSLKPCDAQSQILLAAVFPRRTLVSAYP